MPGPFRGIGSTFRGAAWRKPAAGGLAVAEGADASQSKSSGPGVGCTSAASPPGTSLGGTGLRNYSAERVGDCSGSVSRGPSSCRPGNQGQRQAAGMARARSCVSHHVASGRAGAPGSERRRSGPGGGSCRCPMVAAPGASAASRLAEGGPEGLGQPVGVTKGPPVSARSPLSRTPEAPSLARGTARSPPPRLSQKAQPGP